MKVRLTRTVKLHQSVIKKTLDILLPHIGPMEFFEERRPLMFEKDNFSWEEFFTLCSDYRKDNSFVEDDYLVVLTELRNEANWFSTFSLSGENTIFIHATDWENYIYCEPFFPISYQILENILGSIVYKRLGEQFWTLVHDEPIGCISDMCGWKTDVTFKLRTADICPTCLKALQETTVNDLITQSIEIFESLRKKMLFNNNLQKPLSFEQNLPFTVAITKRKLSTTLEPFRKLLMLIDHFDCIVRTSVLMIAHLSKGKDELESFILNNRLSERPSLGNWVDALAVLSNETINFDWGFQLPRDFSIKMKQVIQLANDNKITYIRNEQRGHGYIDCQDSGYKKTFQECLPAIEEMEKLLSPLFYRFKYYNVVSHNRISGKKFTICTFNLSGSNPAFLEEEVIASFNDIEEIPMENHVYLVSPDNKKWIDLDPYFKYGECDICHHNRLLMFDGIYMLDPYIGHRFEKHNL